MRFVAIDVETANADQSSICAIGAVEFWNLEPIHEWYSLVDPEDEFDRLNVLIHGIDENGVTGAPKFLEVFPTLSKLVGDSIAVSHTAFDNTAIRRTLDKYQAEPWPARWLDSARVVRRAWPDRFGHRGYGLASVSKFLGVEFQHHHALEDAKAAGIILCRAIADSGIALDDWPTQILRPIHESTVSGIAQKTGQKGASDGPFRGETIVFTGALHIPRREAAELAAGIGFDVGPNVTKKTTVVVVGDQDARKLGGQSKSSKHRKAESLIEQGLRIRIITETDFSSLVTDSAG